jgi:hypothetical protein
VFLQDSVLWRQEFPQHPIFRDPLFQTADYRAFELSVRGALAIAVEEDPHSLAIQKAVPALNDRLRTMTGVIQNGQVTQALSALEGMLVSRIGQLTSAIDDFVGGSFTCRFVPRSQSQSQSQAGSWAIPAAAAGGSVGPLAPVPLPVTALVGATPAGPGQYSMSRIVHTIPELWQEWTVGLQGQPSIERLDELYGSRWRSGPGKASERQFYSRRKTLITEIRRLAAVVKAPPDAEAYNRVVVQLEDERKRAGASLSKVIDTLKKA